MSLLNKTNEKEVLWILSLLNVISLSDITCPVYLKLLSKNSRLLFSPLVWPKVITLSGFYCTWSLVVVKTSSDLRLLTMSDILATSASHSRNWSWSDLKWWICQRNRIESKNWFGRERDSNPFNHIHTMKNVRCQTKLKAFHSQKVLKSVFLKVKKRMRDTSLTPSPTPCDIFLIFDHRFLSLICFELQNE